MENVGDLTIAGREELVETKIVINVRSENGETQVKYYDENADLLGVKINGEIILAEKHSEKTIEEQKRIKSLLKEIDINKAKTLEQLEKEREQEENIKVQQQEEKENKPQLTAEQVKTLGGHKVALNQIVEAETLGNAIGLSGDYIQLIDVDKAKELIPELQISTSQRYIPIEIFSDGTANIIGEDKLKQSSIEGTNSTKENITKNNEGNRQREQNVETFDIVKKGGKNTISIGFDENNVNSPFYEIKYGQRDEQDAREVVYTQLESKYEPPLKSEKETEEERQDATEGITKGSEEQVTRDDAERYARTIGLYSYDINGNASLDTDKATEILKELSRGGNNVKEIIQDAEDNVKQPGPQNNRRY